jgi:hypothetical protein
MRRVRAPRRLVLLVTAVALVAGVPALSQAAPAEKAIGGSWKPRTASSSRRTCQS